MISTITKNQTLETIPEEFFLEYPALRLIGNTDLVELDLFAEEYPGVNISAKTEWLNPGGSIKDRPVLRMLAMAKLSGELKKGQVIIDSSSGNAGIAYSMIGAIGLGVAGLGLSKFIPSSSAARPRSSFSTFPVLTSWLRTVNTINSALTSK